jgi:RNA polymerase sigma factor (sigma-70 family)
MNASPTDLAQLCESLLTDVREGNEGAWERMLDEFGPMVLAAARRVGLRGDDVDDVFQTTWMALHKSVGRIREPAALAAWVGTTARREALRVARRQPSTVVDPETLNQQETAGTEADPADSMEAMELRSLVHEGLGTLDDRCQDLLRRLFFAPESPKYQDIAEALQMKVGSIGPTRIRCLAKLAAWFEEQRAGGLG